MRPRSHWSPAITGRFASSQWSTASLSPGVSGLAVHEGVVYLAGDFTQVGGIDRRGLAAVDTAGGTMPFRLEVPPGPENPVPPENPVFPPRALQWGFDRILAGATVNPFTGSTTFDTVLIAYPRAPASDNATFAVEHDWYLSGGLVWDLRGGRPLAEALAVHGAIMYVGGAFRGSMEFPRWSLAAIDRNGSLTDWDPNVAP